MPISLPARSRGVTLLEMIMAIVIVSIALASVLSVFLVTTRHSADPMVAQQAQLVAEGYLDEILLKKFYDPETNTVCTGTTGGESRNTYDNVCDFNNVSEQPTNQFGATMGLPDYSVLVKVENSGVTLGAINNTGAIRVLRVDVTVTGPAGISVTLSGFRTNYECNTGAEPACKPL
jgi:MSHA pilin protein MshD